LKWKKEVIFVKNKCNFCYLLITRWFIKILLVDTTEMQEILVTRGWERAMALNCMHAGVSRQMRKTW